MTRTNKTLRNQAQLNRIAKYVKDKHDSGKRTYAQIAADGGLSEGAVYNLAHRKTRNVLTSTIRGVAKGLHMSYATLLYVGTAKVTTSPPAPTKVTAHYEVKEPVVETPVEPNPPLGTMEEMPFDFESPVSDEAVLYARALEIKHQKELVKIHRAVTFGLIILSTILLVIIALKA